MVNSLDFYWTSDLFLTLNPPTCQKWYSNWYFFARDSDREFIDCGWGSRGAFIHQECEL